MYVHGYETWKIKCTDLTYCDGRRKHSTQYQTFLHCPDSTRVLSAPDGPHVGPTNLAIRVVTHKELNSLYEYQKSSSMLYHSLLWQQYIKFRSVFGRGQNLTIVRCGTRVKRNTRYIDTESESSGKAQSTKNVFHNFLKIFFHNFFNHQKHHIARKQRHAGVRNLRFLLHFVVVLYHRKNK